MVQKQSEYQKILMKRYGNESEQLSLKLLLEDPAEQGYEDEMLEFLKSHPDASFQELLAFDFSHYDPLEIVDDDELDEDERNELVYQD